MESHTLISNHSDGELRAGTVLRSRYVLEEVIGRGGHSIVFRAKDLHRVTTEESTGGHIAVKALHPAQRANERAIARLAREFQQMQILAHPGIARVFDLDCDGDIWFLTMELVAGQTVSDWMRNPVAMADAMHVIGACSEALDYAHSMGIVHGDLKPSNVLLTPDGRVKLIDFGSVPARTANVETEKNPSLSATPSYASPQVLAGMRAEARDDIFSLACLSYGILSRGERPFGDKSSLEAHRARLCPAAIAGISVDIFAVLARSLAGDREQRAASAQALHRELAGQDETPVVSRAFGASRTVNGGALRRISLASVIVGVLCVGTMLLPAARKIVAGTHEPARAVAHALLPSADAQEAIPVVDSALQAAADTDVAPAETSAPATRSPGTVTFESSGIVAGSAQSMVAIPLKRMQSSRGSASVQWEIESGSAMPNVDYEATKPQVVKFNDGETVRSLFIPLLRTNAEAEMRIPRTFAVSLRRAVGGVKLGPVTRINVTIVPEPASSDISNQVAVTR
jgi:predicted Ser/Thr protein kinase